MLAMTAAPNRTRLRRIRRAPSRPTMLGQGLRVLPERRPEMLSWRHFNTALLFVDRNYGFN